MISWPDLGTRVTVRYRRPAGSTPPLTDAVGHLLAVDPAVRVRTKTGAVVEISPGDVVALRALTDTPVRTSDIRALERAAAAAWPGGERHWLDGWLLRAGGRADLAANSAVPLDISANASAIPAIAAWYRERGLTPLLAVPDRVLALPRGVAVEHTERILVRDLSSVTPERRSGESWRAAVTDAPDGTRWVGISGAPSEELLAWGASRGATRGYLELGDDDADAITIAGALGFRLHHRRRYVRIVDSV
jgi:N-acetylglutamate synthase